MLEDLLRQRYARSKELEAKLLSRLPDFGARGDQVSETLELMFQIHLGQKDRPGGPYIDHVMRVAGNVIEVYGTEDVDLIIAALLHDSVEDRAGELLDILEPEGPEDRKSDRETVFAALERRFGKRIRDLVQGVTNPELNNAEKERLNNDKALKNKWYQEHVMDLFRANPDAAMIKCADFMDNACRLDKVKGARRKNLQAKYGPLMTAIPKFLEEEADRDHPLYRNKQPIIDRIEEAYHEFYVD
ncbi:MAG: HD domain-containing protein [Acidobacteriota bacterium]|nr:HD domain-containing protein [Acidobacteriota bacterium]